MTDAADASPSWLAGARGALTGHASLYRWVLATMYDIAPRLTVGLLVSSLLAGLTPVLLFIAIRGLLDAKVRLAGGLHGVTGIGLGALAPWLILLFGVATLEAVVSLSRKLLRTLLLDRMDEELSARIMTQAGRRTIAFFESRDNQDTIERLRGGVATRMVEFVHRLMVLLASSLQVTTLVGILGQIEPRIILVAVPLFLPYLAFQVGLSRNNFSESQRRSEARRRVGYYVGLLTATTAAAEVRLLGLAEHLTSSFRQVMGDFRRRDERRHLIDFGGGMVFALLTLSGFFWVFALVIQRALHGQASVGDVAVFAAAVVRLRRALEEMAIAISSGVEQAGHINALRGFLALPGEATTAVSPQATADFTPEILCDHLSFAYPGTERLVLDDLNLHIRPGETVAIVGENGCGKSTLVKLLAGFYQPSAGTIRISGRDLSSLPPELLRSRISFVFQEFGRYAATVSENIAYGDWPRLRDDRDAIEAVARRTGLDQRIREMPDGYATLLGRQFGDYEPSGGTWQKIAMARAFARDGPLLILDEPTASVDTKAEYELFQQLGRLAAGKTTILISHRFSTVSMAQRILVMYRGRIVEQGSHAELLALNGHYAELYGYYERRMTGGWGVEPSVPAD